jgi:hypothetical protein
MQRHAEHRESDGHRFYTGNCRRSGLPPAPQCLPRRVEAGRTGHVELGGEKLKAPISGKLLDISATGCKLRFEGDITDRLQLGQVYDRFIAALLSAA